MYQTKDRQITNFGKESIHCGVVNIDKIAQAWIDNSEPVFLEIKEGGEFEGNSVIAFIYDKEGYDISQWVDDHDIFIFKSPYFTYCEECSSCIPNAGDIMKPGHLKAYCLGHDWFDEGIAPYKVYDVETGQEVNP